MSDRQSEYQTDQPLCPECGHVRHANACRIVFEEHGGDRVCECVADQQQWPRLTPERRAYIERMAAARKHGVPSVLHISQLLSEIDHLTTELDDARAAIMVLAQRSPFFVTIDPKGDIETCQFCLEDGKHAPDCPWLLVEAIAAKAGS